jgi:hypothetical protein
MHDLLTVGNRDRLAAAVVRWLMDAEGEHGVGSVFLERLAGFLESVELSELAFAMQSGMLPISSEIIPRSDSADLLVSLAGEPRLALVSVSTALRESFALGEYQAMEASPIALARLLEPTPGLTIPVWNWPRAVKAVLPKMVAGPARDFVAQYLAHDPRAPDASSSVMDLGGAPAAPQMPAPLPQMPSAPPPAPSAPASSEWGGGGGGGLSDGWMSGDDADGGGGGLSDGWMGGGYS